LLWIELVHCSERQHVNTLHVEDQGGGTSDGRRKGERLTWSDEIMVTAVKMSRPYTAIDLKRRMYRQMYLMISSPHHRLSEATRNGGTTRRRRRERSRGYEDRCSGVNAHLRRVRKSDL
jgi:hypothetical protein